MDNNVAKKAPGKGNGPFLGGPVSTDTAVNDMSGRGKVAPKRLAPKTDTPAARQFGPDTGRGKVAALRAPDGDTVKRLLEPVNGSSESNQVRFAPSGPIKESTIALAPKRRIGVTLPANFNG